MPGYDAVFVGSGVNSLTSAALLSRAGWRVLRARAQRPPRRRDPHRRPTSPSPGSRTRCMSSWHPLFVGSAAYAELARRPGAARPRVPQHRAPDRRRSSPTARPRSSRPRSTRTSPSSSATRAGDGAAWKRQFEEFMGSAELSFGVLSSELWSLQGLVARAHGLPQARPPRTARPSAATTLASARDWLEATFASEGARGLLAPWVLHTGLGPEQAVSGFMTQVIGCAIQLGGMPVPRGGGIRLVEALAAIVREGGGELRTGADVRAHPASRAAARPGSSSPAASACYAERAVIASVTPTQLYGSLLARGRRAGRGRALGRGLPLRPRRHADPPRARASRPRGRRARPSGSRSTAIVHVTPGLDGVSRAVNEADRGLLPAEATIVVGQPCAVDPSRAPEGKSDHLDPAAGAAAATGAATRSARSTSATAAGRERCARPTPTASSRGSARRSRTSSARRSSASCSRPPISRRSTATSSAATSTRARARSTRTSCGGRPAICPGHATPIEGLWQIGASTHPGPGLGAGSGLPRRQGADEGAAAPPRRATACRPPSESCERGCRCEARR